MHLTNRARVVLPWSALLAAVAIPILLAGTSPLLAWREPIYIAAGFAGIIALALLLVQPLLAGGYMPALSRLRARRLHRWVGAILVAAVTLHVAGLWITSPPDVVDALLFRSPTPFSAFGVIAMWAVFASALIAGFRKLLRLPPRLWRRVHTTLAAIIIAGTVVHAVLIEGTMETVSKGVLCGLVLAAAVKVVFDLKVFTSEPSRQKQ